jgi:hypothetical protein
VPEGLWRDRARGPESSTPDPSGDLMRVVSNGPDRERSARAQGAHLQAIIQAVPPIGQDSRKPSLKHWQDAPTCYSCICSIGWCVSRGSSMARIVLVTSRFQGSLRPATANSSGPGARA